MTRRSRIKQQRNVDAEPNAGSKSGHLIWDDRYFFWRKARTSAACPLEGAGSQTCSIFPSGSIRYVLRTMPRKDLPRNFFRRREPKASMVLRLGSLKRSKFSFCLALNLACAATESPLAPRMTVLILSKCFFASRNSDASVVQPGVLALG